MPKKAPKPTEKTLCAMRLRVIPGRAQDIRLATWLSVGHGFRNTAVGWLKARRIARAKWLKEHAGLSPKAIKEQMPATFSGSDCKALSKWLTGELEKARTFAVREFALSGSKYQAVAAFSSRWTQLSRGERQEMRDRTRRLNLHLEWLLLPRTVLDQIVRDLDKTTQKAIRDRASAKATQGRRSVRLAGFPQFRKWQHAGSVRLQVAAAKNTEFREAWKRKELYIPGLGKMVVRETGYEWPQTPPKLITLGRDAANHWHVSFVCVAGEGLSARSRRLQKSGATHEALPKGPGGKPAIEGLDMSLPHLAVSSQHGKLGRQKHLLRFERNLRRAQKTVSRRQKGSGRWKRAVRKLGKLHVRVANYREVSLRHSAQQVANRSAIVCIETLRLGFMTQNSRLAKSVHDLGWGRFTQYLTQAMAARGHLLLQCDAFDPTTQACSTPGCGHVERALKSNLKIRNWTCSSCGTHHDRDENAAHNIQAFALGRFLDASPGGESILGTHKLHPELARFIARGGKTAFASGSPPSSKRRQAGSRLGLAVPGKREKPPKPPRIGMDPMQAG